MHEVVTVQEFVIWITPHQSEMAVRSHEAKKWRYEIMEQKQPLHTLPILTALMSGNLSTLRDSY